MKNKYVIDLDNTLIFSDSLNNEAYNYALEFYGYNKLQQFRRITRNVIAEVYKEINQNDLNKIIDIKQEYFQVNLNKLELNNDVVDIVKSKSKDDCVLWTSASSARVHHIIQFFSLNEIFSSFYFSDKKNLSLDIINICKIIKCLPSDLIIFEDNYHNVNELNKLGVYTVRVIS